MTGLAIAGLGAGYRGTPVLHGIDLRVTGGSLTAVLGPSGCGKTTLLRAIAGFLRPTAGSIRVNDRVVATARASLPPERRRITIVPQEAALFPHLSVAANIGYGLPGWRAAARGVRRTRVEELLAVVGLDGYGARRPHQLSGGQQQRVALARALAPRPEIVLFDEPFSALDAGLRVQVRTQVREILAALGTTAVLVTHDQSEALSLADQVAVLREGRIAQVGAPAEIYTDPADLALARFVGDAVVLPATARDTVAITALGRIDLLRPSRGPGSLLLRPEQLGLHSDPVAARASGLVERVDFHGHDATVALRTPSGLRLLARTPAPAVVGVGAEVGIEVRGRGVFFPAERPA